MIVNILKGLKWKQLHGDKIIANIEKPFWDYYHQYKDFLRQNNFFVTKENDIWVIVSDKNSLLSISSKEIKDEAPQKTIDKNNYQIKKLSHGEKLREFQKEHALHLVNVFLEKNSFLDASDPGVGKTYVSLVICKELNISPLVICPKSIIPSWHKVANIIGVKCLDVVNYEKIKTGNTDFLLIKNKSFYWSKRVDVIIWDEAHKLKNIKTINSKMTVSAQKQGKRNILLSATIADSPMDFGTVGYIFGFFKKMSEYYPWMFSMGVKKNTYNYLYFDNNPFFLKKLHNAVFPSFGSRIKIADLGDAFPKTQIISEIYDMGENTKKIDAIYAKMQKEISGLKDKKKMDNNVECIECAGSGKILNIKCKKCNGDGFVAKSKLTIQLRARQEVELCKVPTIIEQTEDLLEEGMSVAIFVSFRETVSALCKRLKTDCTVQGLQKPEEREQNMRAFINDEKRVIICNIAAGGLGVNLHDINGKYPRAALISPNFSGRDLRQVLGRVWRDGGKTPSLQKIVFAAGTIEEKIADKLSIKLKNMNAINDGDLVDIAGEYLFF